MKNQNNNKKNHNTELTESQYLEELYSLEKKINGEFVASCSQFNIESVFDLSKEDKDLSSYSTSYFSIYSSDEVKLMLRRVMNNEPMLDEVMEKKLFQNTFIFTILLVLTIIMYIGCIVKIKFFKKIPPAPPVLLKFIVLGLLITFSLLVFIFSCYGLGLSRTVFLNPVKESQCTFLYIAKAFLKKPTDIHAINSHLFEKWEGIYDIHTQLSQLQRFFNESIQKSPLINISQIHGKMYEELFENVEEQIEFLYDEYVTKKIYNPDVETHQKNPFLTPGYFQTLGPYDKLGTPTYIILQDIQTNYKNFVESIAKVHETLQHFQNNSNNYYNQLQSTKIKILDNSLKFIKQVEKMADEMKDEQNELSSKLTRIKFWLTFVLIYSIMAIAGYVCYQFFNKLGILIHCSWCAGGILIIIGLIGLMSAFIFGTTLENGFCMSSRIMLAEPEYTQKYLFSSKYFQKSENIGFKTVLSECIYQKDGKFVDYLDPNLPSLMSHASFVQQYMNQFLEFNDSRKNIPRSSQDQVLSQIIEEQLTKMQKQVETTLENYNIAATSLENQDTYGSTIMNLADQSVALLNLWTNWNIEHSKQFSNGNCNISQDYYVFNKNQCIYGSKSIFNPETEMENTNLGQPTCIIVNEQLPQGLDRLRYTKDEFQQCKQVTTNYMGGQSVNIPQVIHESFNNLDRYVQSVYMLYNFFQIQIYEVKNQITKMDHHLLQAYKMWKGNTTELQYLYESNKLEISQSCKFAENIALKIRKTVCVQTLDGVYDYFFRIANCIWTLALLWLTTLYIVLTLFPKTKVTEIRETVLVSDMHKLNISPDKMNDIEQIRTLDEQETKGHFCPF